MNTLIFFLIWYVIGVCSAAIGTVVDYYNGTSITLGDMGRFVVLSALGPIVTIIVILHIDHIYKLSGKVLFERKQ